MPRFIILLRGVNVGKAARVPMAAFKGLLEDQGFTAVKTLLNSGNAVVTGAARPAAAHAQAVAAAVQQQFGVSTPVIVKSAAELDAVIRHSPMQPPEAEHSRFLVAFGPDRAALHGLAPLLPLAAAPERFVVTDQAAYLHCPAGLLDSRLATALLGKAGRAVTTRNWATVLKLQAALAAA